MVTPLQAGRLRVQVCCALPDAPFDKAMLVPRGQTVGWCVNASGLYALHPALKDTTTLAVWNHPVSPETLLEDGDRVEVLLPIDPTAQARVRKLKKEA